MTRRKADTQQAPEHADVLLLEAREAARLCGRSLRTWRTWDAGGLVPSPVRIGRSVLWRRGELEAWVAAGCPDREAWHALSLSAS